MVFIAFSRDSPTVWALGYIQLSLNHQTQTSQTVAACVAGNQFSLPGLSSQGSSDSEVEIAPNRCEQWPVVSWLFASKKFAIDFYVRKLCETWRSLYINTGLVLLHVSSVSASFFGGNRKKTWLNQQISRPAGTGGAVRSGRIYS